ncbi:hypothetical protein [Pseudobutyrivibrio sp. LB2011]|uniref:hypothetical protein n=1 Tax=Pseudobutyrivibrio sp. LB2011 TaxID=1408312 RepID=UPI0005D23F32|nr:hypothetical protein [Pseudobutyrivibrio sp. LB2011]
MGIFEGITHSEEIKELLDDAQLIYDNAKTKFDSQKKSTTKSLETLGRKKVNAYSKDMTIFLDSFGAFNNVQMVCKNDDNYDFIGKNEKPNELVVNMQNATYNASEIIKAGTLAVGTGALVGVATYGGVAMLAHASTGTAISTLNGIAKKNATLAWFGGGSLASGGMGIAGGTVVLGGVVIGAIAIAGGMIAGAQGKAKLAEAKKVHAEAELAVSKMNIASSCMQGIESVSNNYIEFISELSVLFSTYISKMNSIASKHQRGSDGKIEFDELSEVEQKTLHLSWLLAQLYYNILSVPLLNKDGELDPKSRQLLQKAKLDLSQISNQSNELEEEQKKIKNLLEEAKKLFDKVSNKFYKKKQKTTKKLETIGRKRVYLWKETFAPFMDALTHFENISVNSCYPYSVTDIPIEFIFESCENVLSYINHMELEGLDTLNSTGFVEVALFGGEDFLGELAQIKNNENPMQEVHRHDMSLWFTGELDKTLAENMTFGTVTEGYISAVGEMVQGITGRENLAQAIEINQEVKSLEAKINKAIGEFDATTKKCKKIISSISRLNKVQARFLNEIEAIEKKYNTTSMIEYSLLKNEEKNVFEMSFEIAKMQYTILASCMLAEQNGGDMDDTSIVADTACREYRKIKKDTLKNNNADDITVVNLLWKNNADVMLYLGFIISVACIIFTFYQLLVGKMLWLIGIAGAIVSWPIFYKFKDFSNNRLFFWRCIRIAFALLIVILVEILG